MKFEFAKSTPLTAARRVTLNEAPDRQLVEAIRQRLAAVEGVKWLELHSGQRGLRVGYDVAVLGYAPLLEELEQAGAVVNRSGWNRWRDAWYRFMDQHSCNGGTADPTCCGSPPGSGRSRRG